MLIPNTIFRMGGAAIVLTNRAAERRRARYELAHLVRVHLGADDEAFRCVYQHADAAGNVGVELDRNLVRVAARAMQINLTRLGPLVLPLSEKLMFAANWVARRVARARCAPYVPDFTRAFNHFCLHAGGRGVVEGLSKQLGLSQAHMAPSASTLHWFGNTSSSTVWYSFGFVESFQGVRRGDLVWQIAFGSGFKCNSAVWRALRTGKVDHRAWRHVAGREGAATQALAAAAAATQAERVAKAEAAGAAPPANGDANGHANGHAAPPAARSLRSRKVVA
jgi:3-ketoacyl-CoA synthase